MSVSPIDSNLTAPSIQPFARGADVSWLPQMEATGFHFHDENGEPTDCLKILRSYGLDSLRLRVFVHPSEDPRSGHSSPEEVVAFAARANGMGFRIMVNFHYSDTWADPGHQAKPAAWAHHTIEELENDVYEHTHDVLTALKVHGITPAWVQVGNEIPDGMLWPEGRLADGKNLAGLINAGYCAVKAVDPSSKVIVHLDRGNDNGLFRNFFDALTRHGARFDVIGLSYYPYWLKTDYTENIGDLEVNLRDVVARYNKEVMVVEVGGEDIRPTNTRAMLAAVLRAVRSVPGGKGLGVFYWEPQGAAAWSHYNLSCWSADGRPTEALEAFTDDKAQNNI